MKRVRPRPGASRVAKREGGMAPVEAPKAIEPVGLGPLEQTCFHVSRAYSNYVALLERVLAELGLKRNVRPGMGHVLFALFERDDLIIKDLVRRVSLTPSTLTGILTNMETGKLITRVQDKTDRRAVRIKLTSIGRSLEARCMTALERVNAVMEAGLTAPQVREAKLALAAMSRTMQDEARRPRTTPGKSPRWGRA